MPSYPNPKPSTLTVDRQTPKQTFAKKKTKAKKVSKKP